MRRNMVGPKRRDAMLGFALVAKGLTILGPLLVVVIYNCEHEEEGDTERYWQRKIKLWQQERRREEAAGKSSL
jgi:hypothetical protein